MTDQKTCFVISPIGSSDSQIRSDSDKLLKYIITPPVKEFGYIIKRADELEKPGSITQQIIEMLLNADLVIADLTNHNPNVFYELAIRHATQKPYIQMIKEGQTIPFDVGDLRTIKYDFDIEYGTNAINSLKSQINEINSANFKIYSPVTILLNPKDSSKSEDYTQYFMQEINSKLNKLLTNASENEVIRSTNKITIRDLENQYFTMMDKCAIIDKKLEELYLAKNNLEAEIMYSEREGDLKRKDKLINQKINLEDRICENKNENCYIKSELDKLKSFMR
nr:hypothetical protein [uncultured Methanospirillum sp.]